ncbi:MAG TPA: hypothetical protein VMU75_04805 [Acidimicrobiales bacterium]|nr:hypothetical protein [Acidimicrobiales bacterium]
MRKGALLAGVVIGACAGWRAARSGLGALVPAPRSASSGPTIAVSGETVEKAKALADLGRERVRDVLTQVLGGHTGHAA